MENKKEALSKIYVPTINDICFEDLNPSQQEEYLSTLSNEDKDEVCLRLADTINEVWNYAMYLKDFNYNFKKDIVDGYNKVEDNIGFDIWIGKLLKKL